MRHSILLVAPLVIAAAPGKPQQRVTMITNGGVPAVSPKGDIIAYVSNRDGMMDVYVATPDGSHHQRVTNDSVPESTLSWTEDGRLVFSTWNGSETSVYAVSPPSPTPRVIATMPSRRPYISPDGTRLLYSDGRFPEVRITVSALDGSDSRALTPPGLYTMAVFSPDQKQVAYGQAGVNQPPTIQPPTIWVMDADGTNMRQLTHFTLADGVAEWPAWSPDGRKLAVQVGKYDRRQPANSTAHIWIIDVASGDAVKLNPHDQPYRDETPSWFPDGERIAFQSDRTGRMEVWSMRVDGSGAAQITR